jgi:hypothetical protein
MSTNREHLEGLLASPDCYGVLVMRGNDAAQQFRVASSTAQLQELVRQSLDEGFYIRYAPPCSPPPRFPAATAFSLP